STDDGETSSSADDVRWCGLEQMGGNSPPTLVHLVRDDREPATTEGSTPARKRPNPGQSISRVTLADSYVLEADAEPVGDDLGKRRGVLLALRDRAACRGHPAVWLDAHPGTLPAAA